MAKVKHGHAANGMSLTYKTWHSMKSRCNYKFHAEYKNYGAKGIKVCERWNLFENFLEDMGERPSLKHTIDRVDNEEGYSPDNCRWATQHEQANNRKPKPTKSGDLWSPRLQEIIDKYCGVFHGEHEGKTNG